MRMVLGVAMCASALLVLGVNQLRSGSGRVMLVLRPSLSYACAVTLPRASVVAAT